MGMPRFRGGNWFSRPLQLPPASEKANALRKALENQFPGLNQGIPMFIFLKTLCFSRKRSQNLLPIHGHEPFWLHPYYMAKPNVPNLLKKPMFSGILSFFLKNMSSGGAAGHYDFHAGAWLRQAPAFTCGRQRGLTATHHLYNKCRLYPPLGGIEVDIATWNGPLSRGAARGAGDHIRGVSSDSFSC